ncbi:amidohydrolase family protein [Bordetella bronchiseptica MBORD635]|uniref:amidohydrolase family protein n=1 Tax=Bordetella bronchiseptica TaxID=518 RepID=UPI0004617F15|nr:amidohydrolase family protein [Bordetella bronchiseptica]KDC79456.1 amidohydrolase family protein [Bordetella bronchiseptica MBORD635]
MNRIIDMRCRPPLPEFREYFDIPRITWHGARTGAKQVSRAFVEGSMDLFFEEMDQAGIEIAVVQGRNSPAVFMGKQFNAAFIPNERLAQIQDQYAGRFVCFAGIDVSNTAHNAVEETVCSIKSLGLKGIFIEPGRQIQSTPDDERIFPVYEKCIELDIPVNLMSGPYAGADIGVSDPLYVDRLCTRYPELKIILGHGGYPYVQQILGVAFKHTNLFVSPDMYVFAPGGQAYIDAANGALRDQMVYGSAYPLRPVTQTVSDTLGLGLSADSERAYLELNARKLLNI